MLTKAGRLAKIIQMANMSGSYNNGSLGKGDTIPEFKTGTMKSVYNMNSAVDIPVRKTASNINIITDNNEGVGYYIGTGTGVPNENDYDLFNRIYTRNSRWAQAGSHVESWDGDKMTQIISWTIANPTQDTATIAEIGYVNSIYNGSLSSSWFYALLSHTMLDDPLVLAPAETGILQLKYELDFSNFLITDSATSI